MPQDCCDCLRRAGRKPLLHFQAAGTFMLAWPLPHQLMRFLNRVTIDRFLLGSEGTHAFDEQPSAGSSNVRVRFLNRVTVIGNDPSAVPTSREHAQVSESTKLSPIFGTANRTPSLRQRARNILNPRRPSAIRMMAQQGGSLAETIGAETCLSRQFRTRLRSGRSQHRTNRQGADAT